MHQALCWFRCRLLITIIQLIVFQIELTEEQKSLYPEIADLRERIERLQADELSLRSQIYYGATR